MNRSQLENLYRVNGLTDYTLKTTDDLLKVHGIDYKTVDGYDQLDDLNRLTYEKFILNLFNCWGLDSRATLIPKGIYWVSDNAYLFKDPQEDYFNIVGQIIHSIDRNGNKTLLHEFLYEDKHFEIGDPELYLRFEYEHEGKFGWLHVINGGNEWY